MATDAAKKHGRYRLQFCHGDTDITGDFHAETDATTVRLWDSGDLVCVAVSVHGDGRWRYQASDYGADPDWDTEHGYATWQDAITAFGYGDEVDR